ncbi:MAG: Smr/MutS family protein [Xanthobacteraceae bacterium]|nr:Smr/MutS family protein [Xanthobacteraceae bacterium]
MNGDRQGRRDLKAEDRALWDQVKKTIEPLRDRPNEVLPDEPAAEKSTAPKRPPKARPAPVAPAVKGPPPLAPIDRRLRQRLARGGASVDARLDLHGLKQAEAHARLGAFLEAAQARGASLVLVITGKGARAPADSLDGERGVLRRQVPMWLALPELRPLVVGFEEATPAHGGAGALYVRIRRRRA